MLSTGKFGQLCEQRQMTVERLAEQLVRGGLDKRRAAAAVRNWRKGLFRPIPRRDDIRRLAAALSVEANELVEWRSTYRYAPISARKASVVTQLIAGRAVQDALDILKFTSKRAAEMVSKVLKTAIADADEQQADVDNLYVCQASVDDAGVRVGTKRFRAKDRGKAYSISQKACHINITVAETKGQGS